MTDERLAELFAEGTAPERDAAFARRVGAEIGRTRLGWRLIARGGRALLMLAFAGGALISARTIEPALARTVEGAPQFMGVPLPLLLGVLSVGLAYYACRFVRLRPE